MRPPHIAQAPPCTAKQSQSPPKSLIYKGGGACARLVVLSHAAGANAHCLGVAWSARSSVRAYFDGNIRSSTGQASSKCSKVRQHHRDTFRDDVLVIRPGPNSDWFMGNLAADQSAPPSPEHGKSSNDRSKAGDRLGRPLLHAPERRTLAHVQISRHHGHVRGPLRGRAIGLHPREPASGSLRPHGRDEHRA